MNTETTRHEIHEIVERLISEVRLARKQLEDLLIEGPSDNTPLTNLMGDLLDDLLDALNTADNVKRKVARQVPAQR